MTATEPEDIIDGWDRFEQEQPINPVQVESIIRQLSNRIARGVRITSDLLEAYKKANAAYDRAYASAYMGYDGPAHAKRYAAELAVAEERDAMDAAEVAWRYADKQARALGDILSGYQSIGSSVRTMYGVAGR